MTEINPTELRVTKDRRTLKVTFSNGDTFELPAEMLRVMSPSAEVQGHSPDQKRTIGGKKNVEIMTVVPVGNYAIRIGFDDLHDTGIYSWPFLHEMGHEKEAKWAAYLEELATKGLSR